MQVEVQRSRVQAYKHPHRCVGMSVHTTILVSQPAMTEEMHSTDISSRSAGGCCLQAARGLFKISLMLPAAMIGK